MLGLKNKAEDYSPQMFFFSFTRNLYLIENVVQFHCLSSYRNDLYRNDFVSKRLDSFSRTVSSKRDGAATQRPVLTDIINRY